MGASSRIAMKDGKIYRSVYCHNDGEPTWVGKKLFQHYQNPEIIRQVLDLGNLSGLGAEIGSKHDFDDYYYREKFDECTFFHRDRGDENMDATPAASLKELLADCHGCDADYLYLWKDEKWWFAYVWMKKTFKLKELTVFDVLGIKPCHIDEPLIAADWLEENGRGDDARKIRMFINGEEEEEIDNPRIKALSVHLGIPASEIEQCSYDEKTLIVRPHTVKDGTSPERAKELVALLRQALGRVVSFIGRRGESSRVTKR